MAVVVEKIGKFRRQCSTCKSTFTYEYNDTVDTYDGDRGVRCGNCNSICGHNNKDYVYGS